MKKTVMLITATLLSLSLTACGGNTPTETTTPPTTLAVSASAEPETPPASSAPASTPQEPATTPPETTQPETPEPVAATATTPMETGEPGTGIVGEWKMLGTEADGASHTIEELYEIAEGDEDLEGITAVLTMKYYFASGGTGEQSFTDPLMSDVTSGITWEGTGESYTMTNVEGKEYDIAYDPETDTFRMQSGDTTFVFGRI